MKKMTGLSSREVAVLRLVYDGMTPAQIAESGDVSIQTVYNQLRYALLKLGVKSYDKAAIKAKRLNLI